MEERSYPTLCCTMTDKSRFVDFWAAYYDYPNEDIYNKAMRVRPLTREAVMDLYKWKRGIRKKNGELADLSAKQRRSTESNFIAHLSELEAADPEDLLSFFKLVSGGGVIYRIFFLHIWQPDKYPIYDQHVHRAMHFLKHGEPGEMPETDNARIKTYVEEYERFYNSFPARQHREVDKALFTFGRFLKTQFGGVVQPR